MTPTLSELHDSPAYRAEATLIFTSGLRYFEVNVRVLSVAENAIIAADSTGKTRIIRFADCSYASEFIARQNEGRGVMLKIRAWS